MSMVSKNKFQIIIIGLNIFSFLFCPIILYASAIEDQNIKISGSESWYLTEPGCSRDIITDSNNDIITLCWEDYFDSQDRLFSNIIIYKYNEFGEKLWQVKWGEHGNAFPIAITVDSDDNIYAVGSFGESFIEYDVILLKYSKNGNFVWSRMWGVAQRDQSRNVAVDSANSVYITGDTYNSSEGKNVMFLVKFDTYGEFKWSRFNSEPESGRAITIDSYNRICIGLSQTDETCLIIYDKFGNFLNKTNWYRDSGGHYMQMSKDLNDNVYLASRETVKKFNINNELLLNLSISYLYFSDVAVDTQENIYIASNAINYEEMNFDYCITVYDYSGNFDYNFTCGTPGFDRLTSITIDNFNNLYLLADNWSTIVLVKNPSPGEKYYNNQEEEGSSFNPTISSIHNVFFVTSIIISIFIIVVFLFKGKRRISL